MFRIKLSQVMDCSICTVTNAALGQINDLFRMIRGAEWSPTLRLGAPHTRAKAVSGSEIQAHA